MTDAEIFAALAVLAGAACHSATGFGFALVAAPLMAAALPPERAIATLLLLGVLTSSLTLGTERRRPEPLWGEAFQLLAWGAAGALAGGFVLARLDRDGLQLMVTLSVLAALAVREVVRRRPPRNLKGSDPFRKGGWLVAAGLCAGALTTTTSANGPPMLLYLLARRTTAARMRDTLSVCFIGFGAIGLAALAVGEPDLAFPRTGLLGALAGAAGVGHVAGRPVFARLAKGRYDQTVTGLLLVSVLVGAGVALT